MSTKFNIQDRRQGNTSFERNKELIGSRIPKIDESVQKHGPLLNIATIQLSLIQTIDLYNPEEATREKSEINEINTNKQIELSAFNELNSQIDLFIDLLDRMITFCINQNQEKNIQDVNDEIKTDKEKEAQVRAFNQETINMLNKAKELREAILKSLYLDNIENIRKINKEIEELNKRIKNIDQNIAHITQDALHSYQENMKDIEVNGHRLFEGKNKNEVNKITKELFDVHFDTDTQIEIREIRKAELKSQYTDNRREGASTLEHHAWKSSPEFAQCKALDREITELQRNRVQKVNRVLESNDITIPRESRDVAALITNNDQTAKAAKKVAKQKHNKQAIKEEVKSKIEDKKELVGVHVQVKEARKESGLDDKNKLNQEELIFGLEDDDLNFDFAPPSPIKPK